jgi:hypothetical protein
MKMGFYRGMYPLIPFIIVSVVIALQTIPASIGNFLFKTVVVDSGLQLTLEQFCLATPIFIPTSVSLSI